MGRTKSNKVFGKPARISVGLHAYLEALQRAEKDRKGVEPAFGELLDRMLAATQGDSRIDVNIQKPNGDVVQYQAKGPINISSDSATLVVAEGESPWVTRLLAVLRSGNQVVTEAIQKNLEAFCLIPGVADVGGGNPPTPNLPQTPSGIIERAEDTHDAAQEALKRHQANRRGNQRGGKRA